MQTPLIPAAQLATDYRRIGPPLRPEAEGLRADRFLARAFPFHSRLAWKEACQAGHLLINGRPVRASTRLKAGDQLAIFHPLSAEPEVDDQVELLRCDGGILALNKPGNLPMHEGGSFRRRTFQAVVAERFGAEWHPVHRLDRETSGVVICAATPQLRHQLSLAFEQRQVRKTYQAICQGEPDWAKVAVDQPLALDATSERPRYKVALGGAPSSTGFTRLGLAKGAALLEATPRTGRPNQIRAHLSWLGHPLLGDKLYHLNPAVYAAYHCFGDTSEVRALAGFPRHALHAAAVSFCYPGSSATFSVEAALPEDLASLWASLTTPG